MKMLRIYFSIHLNLLFYYFIIYFIIITFILILLGERSQTGAGKGAHPHLASPGQPGNVEHIFNSGT